MKKLVTTVFERKLLIKNKSEDQFFFAYNGEGLTARAVPLHMEVSSPSTNSALTSEPLQKNRLLPRFTLDAILFYLAASRWMYFSGKDGELCAGRDGDLGLICHDFGR